jgi:hypothetical protein
VLSAALAALQELREEVRPLRAEIAELRPLCAEIAELRPLRAEIAELRPLRELLPERVAARVAREREQHRHNFISALICTAENGYGRDVEPFLALCRETWGEERLWDAVKDLPHGAVPKVDADGDPLWELDEDGDEVRDDEGERVQVIDPYGKKLTRLMYAAQAGDVARLRWLIARGARLELKDWRGRTALHWASVAGCVETVRELLLRNAAVDAAAHFGAAHFGATPLIIASWAGHLEVVRELLARGAAVDGAANDGATPLFIASHEGHLEVVGELLSRGANPRLVT